MDTSKKKKAKLTPEIKIKKSEQVQRCKKWTFFYKEGYSEQMMGEKLLNARLEKSHRACIIEGGIINRCTNHLYLSFCVQVDKKFLTNFDFVVESTVCGWLTPNLTLQQQLNVLKDQVNYELWTVLDSYPCYRNEEEEEEESTVKISDLDEEICEILYSIFKGESVHEVITKAY